RQSRVRGAPSPITSQAPMSASSPSSCSSWARPTRAARVGTSHAIRARASREGIVTGSVVLGSGAGCLLAFGNNAAERVVDRLGGTEVRPELGVDGHDLAHAASGVVAATRPTAKSRLTVLGHLLERCGAGLTRLLHRVVVPLGWQRAR